VIAADNIGGVHIKYLHHCRRQLWLYGRGFRPEMHSDLAQFGEAVHETSYGRTVPVDLGAARLDFIDGQNWVHEVKSSPGPTKADEAQVIHYCYRLSQAGIDAGGGILHYPKTRRTHRVRFPENGEARALEDIDAALAVLTSDQSPPRISRASCRGCSYLDYCWASG
jgi:CRISPR-associated exonuclease Cas4